MAFVWLKPKKTQVQPGQDTNVPSPQPRPLPQRPLQQEAPAPPGAVTETQQQVATGQRVINLTFGRLVMGETYCLYYSDSELGINIDICGPRDRIVEVVKQLAQRAEKNAQRGQQVLKPGLEPIPGRQLPVPDFEEDLKTKWLLVLYDARTILRELGS